MWRAALSAPRRAAAQWRRFGVSRDAVLLRDYTFKGKEEKAGSVVSVKAGYLRNFLLPQQIALPATPTNLEKYAGRDPRLPGALTTDQLTVKPSARSKKKLVEINELYDKEVAPHIAKVEQYSKDHPWVPPPEPEPEEGDEADLYQEAAAGDDLEVYGGDDEEALAAALDDVAAATAADRDEVDYAYVPYTPPVKEESPSEAEDHAESGEDAENDEKGKNKKKKK